MSSTISVVIPTYNSAFSLDELHRRLTRTLPYLADDQYEIILVDDKSSHATWKTIQRLAENNPNTKGIKLRENCGQHNALLCGVRESCGSVIVTIDDDLQYQPEDIPKLMEEINRGSELVYGSPVTERRSKGRRLSGKIAKTAISAVSFDQQRSKDISSFRAFRAELRDAFSMYKGSETNLDALLSWGTKGYTVVQVSHRERVHGKSGYSPYKLVKHFINQTASFSTRPLRAATIIGLSLSGLGLALLAFLVATWIFHGSVVPGFLFLASAICIFNGAQLLSLGIMGEYVSRIYTRTLGMPSYVISTRTQ